MKHVKKQQNHLRELKKLGEEFNFILLGMGVEPNLALDDFPWMPKQRYKIMKEYMKRVGTLRSTYDEANLYKSS